MVGYLENNNMAYISKSQLTEIINKAPKGTNPQDIVNGLVNRGHIIEGYNQKDSFGKTLAREIIRPFTQGTEIIKEGGQTLGAVAKAGVKLATGKKEAGRQILIKEADRVSKARSKPLEVLGKDVGRVQNVKQAGGVALNLASNFVGGAGAVSTGSKVLKSTLKSAIKTGVKTGAKAGALYGAGDALQDDENPITGAVKGALGGAVAGAVLPMAGKAVSTTLKAVASPFETAITKIAPTLDKIANKIETVVVKPSKTDLQNGFKVENIFKYKLGGSAGKSLEKAEQAISTLVRKADELRSEAKGVIDLPSILDDVTSELSNSKFRNFGNNQRIQNALLTFVSEFESIAPNGKLSVIDGQKVKVALGKIGSWLNGSRDLDANAQETVANVLYTKIKTAIEQNVDDSKALREINKQLSELIPIQNVLIKRVPIAERSSALSLTDIISAGYGSVDPKGWGIFAINRLSRSGKFANVVSNLSTSIKTGASKAQNLFNK